MVENRKEMPQAKKLTDFKVILWGVGIPVVLALVLCVAPYLLDEPLRRITEKKINRNLKGYSVRLPELHVQWINLSVTMKGLALHQQAHPEPPVGYFPVIKATIHWREILGGRLVAEATLEQPKINFNLMQLRSEADSTVPLKKRGWQQALEAIYPLKINTVKINDASVTYIDQNPERPLVLSHLNLQATNIRNIHQPDQVYPSSFHLDTAIFGTGRGIFDGYANFLAEPHPGAKARFQLKNVPIDILNSVASRSNLSIQDGVLRASGDAEYAPKVKIAHLDDLTIQGMKIDYIHSQSTADAEKRRAAIVGKTAKELSNKAGLFIRADQVRLIGCTLGMVNEAADKPYRIFLADADFHLSNFSNQFADGPAQGRLKAKFMGSGRTTGFANFRPEKSGPDFDLYVKIEDTQLTTLNDLLRAYGDFDVSGGGFSLVTELHVKDGAISGYIKPFFKEMKVYDRRKDKERGSAHRLYEKLIGWVARILENTPRREVATKADITGPVGKPETSTWQIVIELIKNAFFKAILPIFEKEANGAGEH
ncbi:MAG: DUF748 domain-containing protein [Desulfobulbaceae bacterium]|nr:DUF748 domain-containing protein [Desulfobulbaceae bacterium]